MIHSPASFTTLTLFSLLLSATCCVADESAQKSNGDSAVPTEEQLEFVRKKVLPLLEARCFECHKRGKVIKGGLLMSSRKSMLKGGDSGPTIVPGKPQESLLMEAVRYESFEMPPRTKLPDEEVAILEKWIADGAPWPADLSSDTVHTEESFPLFERKQSHWAWQPVSISPVPSVKSSVWCRDPVDAFVLAKLEAAGLAPGSDADRRTLIRRLYFDIVGLPPSIDRIEAFVNDSADDDTAMSRVVDELLAMPEFGERWGRHWLDLVRYAETLGHEFDYPLHNAWRYRDYVIRALNADVPYNDFVREHVAGDLLLKPRLHLTQRYNESIIATGFWFLCEDKHAPVDVRGEEAAKIDNQIDVFSKTFLGMTVACARCHDHKFDAISTKDYYALAGFLQSSRRQTAWLDPDNAIRQRVDQLKRLRSDAAGIVAANSITADSTGELRQYALAALEAARGEPTEAELRHTADVVFEDFESETFRWEVSGEAFARGPVAGTWPGQQRVSGFQGQRLVNSWIGNDDYQGVLKSPEFTIEQSHITFLIGGGAHKDKTCMNLVVDGKPVRMATGRNRERLRPALWDVSDLKGKTAHLQIVDQQTGAWGHINVDQIVFTDSPSAHGVRRNVATVAAERKCDPDVLKHWVTELTEPNNRKLKEPFSLLAAFAQSDNDTSTADVLRSWKNTVTTASRAAAPNTKDPTTLFADLRNGIPEDWFTTGDAFEPLSDNSQPMLQWGSSGLRVNAGDGVTSAALSRELRGTLSSPTFELNSPEILVRVAGEGCRMRLVIDGYLMHEFSGLLFGGAKQNISTKGEFQWVRFAGDVHRYTGHRAHLEILDEGNGWFNIQEVRFVNSPGAAPPPPATNVINDTLAVESDAADVLSSEALVDFWLRAALKHSKNATAALFNAGILPGLSNEQWKQVALDWTQQSGGIHAPLPVIAITEGSPENERIFIRGNHRNPGEVAERNILTALRSENVSEVITGSGRLQLAEQLVADDNPLTARVAVNRIWHHLFGVGIVESTDNLGVLGKRPTHPELLDYLATDFRAEGWSTKQMIRKLVMSRTYRLSSDRSEAAENLDPTNALLHRARIRRLEGEAVRDAILAISGRLDRAHFGPPVPVHLTAFMQGRGRPKTNGPIDGNGRRSIYISVNRNFLSPLMMAFDVPAPVTTTGKRTTSNVPAQALIMLNNEFVNQQSEIWAARMLDNSPKSGPEILQQAWYELFGRPADQSELQALQDFLPDSSDGLLTKESLTQVCHVLLNSKEFMFLR